MFFPQSHLILPSVLHQREAVAVSGQGVQVFLIHWDPCRGTGRKAATKDVNRVMCGGREGWKDGPETALAGTIRLREHVLLISFNKKTKESLTQVSETLQQDWTSGQETS